MARRSLRASSTGIQQAKIALDCQNLTQKALAEEHQLASWSTIKTIKRVETHQSTLLDQILACDWCTPDITSVILEIKGA